MSIDRTPAAEVLKRLRDTKFTDLSEDLVMAVFAIEHASQFEAEREPSQRALRDLITKATEDGQA